MKITMRIVTHGYLRHDISAVDKSSSTQTNVNFNGLLILLELQICVRQEHLDKIVRKQA